MRIDHVAVWVRDLEVARAFYARHFGATAGPRYENPAKRFASYFLTFPSGGPRLELMHSAVVTESSSEVTFGYAHLALGVGSEAAVDELTARLRADGYVIADGPRRTGDGYYESVVLDPDGNRIEITA